MCEPRRRLPLEGAGERQPGRQTAECNLLPISASSIVLTGQRSFTKPGVAMYQKYDVANKPTSALRQVRARALIAVLVSAAFAVSGCAGSTEQPAAPTTSASSRQPAASAGPTSTPAPTGTPTPTATPSSTPVTAKPDFPPAVAPSALQHGGTYRGVYVTVVRADNYQVKPDDQKRLDAAKKSLDRPRIRTRFRRIRHRLRTGHARTTSPGPPARLRRGSNLLRHASPGRAVRRRISAGRRRHRKSNPLLHGLNRRMSVPVALETP